MFEALLIYETLLILETLSIMRMLELSQFSIIKNKPINYKNNKNLKENLIKNLEIRECEESFGIVKS